MFDGIDGVVARVTHKQSDFGGYADILCDFTIYSLLPISLVIADPSDTSYIIVALLEAFFFLNATSQMYLSALLEKRALGSASTGEMTSVTFPTGLIEGTESMALVGLALALPQWKDTFHVIFLIGIAFNIVYRVRWAHQNLKDVPKPLQETQ